MWAVASLGAGVGGWAGRGDWCLGFQEKLFSGMSPYDKTG